MTDDTMIIKYETGRMELNLHEFFPCNQRDLKKVLGLVWDTETLDAIRDYLKSEITETDMLIKKYSDMKYDHFDHRMKADRALDCNINLTSEARLKYQYSSYMNSSGEKICTKFITYMKLYKEKIQKNLIVVDERYEAI